MRPRREAGLDFKSLRNQALPRGLKYLQQVFPEVNDHTHQGGILHQDVEYESLFGRDIPAKQVRDDHQVGRAGNGQEFTDPLDDAQDDRLEKGH